MTPEEHERRKAYWRAYHAAHREARAAYYKARRAANIEAERARDRERAPLRKVQRDAYYAANKERLNAYSRDYMKVPEHREHINEWKRQDKITNRHRYNEYEATRRAKRKAATVAPIDREAIIRRDRSTCGICRRHVSRKELTLDHIVPLAMNGPHATENLQVAHRACNSSRGAGRKPAQVRLPI